MTQKTTTKAPASHPKTQEIKRQNRSLIKCVGEIARKTKASHLFVYIDAIDEALLPDPLPRDFSTILVTKSKDYSPAGKLTDCRVIRIPDLKLTRMGLVKISVLLALSGKSIKAEDGIIFLTGKAALSQLDTILCFRITDESELLMGRGIAEIPESILPSVFEYSLNIAVELASKGKEGKPIGTIFVLGDEEKVMQLSKQMIINPFKGYERDERNILNPELRETLREFSSLDGAFVISGEGEVIAAGRYLGAAMEGSEIPRGLGSRHIAASGITALTNAVAIVISESTGDIRIFHNGSVMMEIEKQTF